MQPTPTLGTAYHLVADDEQQRAVSGAKRPAIDAAAFQVSVPVKRDQGHSQNKFTLRESKRGAVGPVEHCNFCGKDGHNRDGCFKRIGYPEWWPSKGKQAVPRAACVESETNLIPGLNEEQYQQLVKLLGSKKEEDGEGNWPVANMAGNINQEGKWIIDSGATEHITCDDSLIQNRTKGSHELPVTIPNGATIPVEGRGDHSLPNGMLIKNVLHVPDFKCNLLSVSRLSKDLQCAVTFFPNFCVMQDLRSRALIGAGECINGLYKMGTMGTKRQVMMTTADKWHKRSGHASISKLSHVGFLKKFSLNSQNVCDSCVKAKFARLPFPLSMTKASACFDLIHCDVWGKYRVPSFTQANYFLTIVDDFSRAIWVFLLKDKHEASSRLKDFHKMVQVQFDKNIRRIRCDNGGEFTSNNMLDFYAKMGIVLETTCPHTPQQNGVVERKHRHLLETARALRFEANLPTKFWGECVLTATHIINRLPSNVSIDKTPYELLYNQMPEYEHLKVFGCLAYYRSTETKGDKFEMRGRPGIFLGYPQGTKGYKIYDLQHKKIIVSRDVKFVEGTFPFKIFNAPKNEEEVFNWPRSWDDELHDSRDMLNEDVDQEPMQDENNNQVPMQDGEGFHQTEGQVIEENLSKPSAENENGPEICERPKRNRSKPTYLGDYDVRLPPSLDHEHSSSSTNHESSTVHPLAHYVSYDNFTNSHKAFLSAITTNNEPKNFDQAVQNPKWVEAMKSEIQALEKNGTWTLQQLPKGKHAIDSKWVYKIKFKPSGEIERYKARLVAKGFTQIEGVDFHDTFAPVAKLVTVRSLLAVAVKEEWHIHQLDVNNAFLHGDLHEDIYMKIPQGFGKPNDNRVCKLKKSLYGLKQASRNWYQKFTTFLQRLGFRQSRADHSLFLFKRRGIFVAALIYVDDVIITGNDMNKIQETKELLNKEFSIKDLGPLKFFLGIEVARTKEGMVLSQLKYTLDILEDTGMMGCRPSSIPMEQNLKLDKRDGDRRVDANQYRRLVGRLLYLQATRPDIAYSVNVLSQFVSDPRESHLKAANHVLRYLKATPGQDILLTKEGGTNLIAYSDSDWLGCPITRRSRTGYLLLLGGAPISWKSKKQSVVSRSSAEAEY